MYTLKEIWNLILDNKTSSAITFFSLLFAVFVWLLTIRQRGNDKKEEVKRHLELKWLLTNNQLKAERPQEPLNPIKPIPPKNVYEFLKKVGTEEEKVVVGKYNYLKNQGVIKEEFSDVLLVTMIAVFTKHATLNLVPVRIETDGKIGGRAVFTSKGEDLNERMCLFVQLLKEIEQATTSTDIGIVEVTDEFINIIVVEGINKYQSLRVVENITDNQCKQYFYKWCVQLQVKNTSR